MKISLAVALLLNCVDATSLQTKTSEPLDDLTYLMEGASSSSSSAISTQGVQETCDYNLKRMNGETNSEKTFYKANFGCCYWHDPSFLSDTTSVAWNKKFGRDANNFVWSEYSDGKNFKWLKPADQIKKSGSKQKFSLWGPTGKPVPEGIAQGGTLTCWFLASLSALAEVPKRIQHGVFQKSEFSEGGVYRLRFWVKDKWQYVNVNDELPTYRNGAGLVFTQKSDKGAWWVPIAEKAYAKLNVNYDGIMLGYGIEALRALTGAASAYHGPEVDYDTAKAMYRYYTSKNFPMTAACCKPGAKTYGLITGHEYTVLDMVDLLDDSGAEVHTLVKMRNPWAEEHYKGPWSDKSNKWTKAWKKQVNHKAVNDGTFYITFDQLYNDWDGISVAMTDPDFDAHKQQQEVFIGKSTKNIKINNPVTQKFEIQIEDYGSRLHPRKQCLPRRQVRLCFRNSNGGKEICDWYDTWEQEYALAEVGTKHKEFPAGDYNIRISNENPNSQPQLSVTMQIFSNKQKIKILE